MFKKSSIIVLAVVLAFGFSLGAFGYTDNTNIELSEVFEVEFSGNITFQGTGGQIPEATGDYDSERLLLEITANVDVDVDGDGQVFFIDADNTLPTEWFWRYNDGDSWNGWFSREAEYGNKAEYSLTSGIDERGEDGYAKAEFFARVTRSGLEDRAGTYQAALNINVSKA